MSNEMLESMRGVLDDVLDYIKKDLIEVYRHRNILRSLVYKDLFGKYRNSFLGFVWNFITPIILLLMYYVVFSEIRTGGTIENKWVFIATAIFGFHFMTSCIVGGTTAFTGHANMLKKMYVPKEILVLSKSISSFIVCLIGYVVVLVYLVISGYGLELSFLLLPLVLMIMFVFGVGCVFLLSSVAVYVRDIQYALGPMGIAFFVLTPMRYMASDAEGLLETIIWCNPLTYFVESFHDILYWGTLPSVSNMCMCLLLAAVTLIGGYTVFRKLRRGFVKRL